MKKIQSGAHQYALNKSNQKITLDDAVDGLRQPVQYFMIVIVRKRADFK